MDTSKEYISMCKKAVEVHEGKDKNPLIGDRVYMRGYEGASIIVGLDEFYDDETWKVKLSDDFAYEDTRDLIWLPRQDQLQGMLLTPIYDFWDLIKDFSKYADKVYKPFSMEQLWLAFVMKEKFNKTWDGNQWILQNQ